MILTIDIGNTNITVVLYDMNGKNLHEFRLLTKNKQTGDELGLVLQNFIIHTGIPHTDIKAVMVASVVPDINDIIDYACDKYILIKPKFITAKQNAKLNIPLEIKIDFPETLGADRIVGAVGGIHRHGQNLIIFDFGTATVCDVIAGGHYLGGMIIPGINTSINAMHEAASLLPFYKFQKPSKALPTSTNDALSAGIFYATLGMIEKITKEIQQQFNRNKFNIIATGGLSCLIKGHTDVINVYDSDITTFGLYRIYMHNFR